MEGSCLASPRWVSLLVAEIYYPDTTFPNLAKLNTNRSPVNGVSPPKVVTRHKGTFYSLIEEIEV